MLVILVQIEGKDLQFQELMINHKCLFEISRDSAWRLISQRVIYKLIQRSETSQRCTNAEMPPMITKIFYRASSIVFD